MKVHYHISTVGGTKGRINYLHMYIGHEADKKDYMIVDESIIKFGKPGILFQKPGEKIHVGKQPLFFQLKDIAQSLIAMIFEDDFDLDYASFQEINL